jgi:ketosteroid isomerase-like protein
VSNADRILEALAPVFSLDEVEVDAALIERLVSALGEVAADDVVCLMSGSESFQATFEGLEGVREAWTDWLEVFATVRIELEEVEVVGENVVTLARQTGITRHSQVEVVQPSAAVWKFRDGLIARIEFHLDRAEALASARKPVEP